MNSQRTIDINADLGENCGDDAAMLDLVTTANVACGGHAGGGLILSETVASAARRGVAVGAHPSYPDREHFGRVSMRTFDAKVLGTSIFEQIINVAEVANSENCVLSHVKAHGALYNDAAVHEDIASLILTAVEQAEAHLIERGLLANDSAGKLPIMGMPNSTMQVMCESAGRRIWSEAFADRAYTSEGRLVPRSEPGAVLDHDAALAQAISIATSGTTMAVDGTSLSLDVVTLCVHGDTPGAVALAADIRAALADAGVCIAGVSS